MVTKEQVKKCLDKYANDYLSTREETECFDYAIKVVDEHKTGRWINGDFWSEGCGMGETYGYYYKCSECGTEVNGDYKECKYNFCPNCGAKMEGAEE